MAEILLNNEALSTYGVTLLAGSYISLLTPPNLKEWVSNDDPMKDGIEYAEPTKKAVQPRTVDLIFGIAGNSQGDFLNKYTSFISELQSGMVTLYIPDLTKYYHLRYESCTTIDDYNLMACKLVVKFTEPNPRNNNA